MTSARPSAPARDGDGPVLAVLSRGEAIRNFLYGGTLERVQAEVPVRIGSVKPDQQVWDLLRASFDDLHELPSVREERWLHWTRELLRDLHDRTVWSRAAREHWRRRRQRRLRARLTQPLCVPFARPPVVRALARLERRWSLAAAPFEPFRELLGPVAPRLLFQGSHLHGQDTTPLVLAAQRMGIPTAAFIFSWDNMTSRSRIIPSYDHYLVWNEHLRTQLLEQYPEVAEDRVHITGTPQFDFHFQEQRHWTRERFLDWAGVDGGRPLIFYATGTAKHMPGEERIVAQLADQLAELPLDPRPQLMVRVYPKDQTGRFDALRAARPDIRFLPTAWVPAYDTPLPEDLEGFTNTLRFCDVGVNVASTVSLECCMFDKPVVNPAFNPPGADVGLFDFRQWYEYDHYARVVASGAVSVAWSAREMGQLILDALAHPERRHAERRALIESFFGDTLDGRSGERVARVVLELSSLAAAPVAGPA